MFQWNYLNGNWINKSCFDIDGVLCVDPTEEENDDGEKYKAFLRSAKPLFIPKFKIHTLVTSRLEKYRSETELWLKEHDVDYGNLIMLNLPSKEERIRQNAHAKFKAETYAKLKDTILFVESERNQAIEIAQITGKPCICVSSDELFDGTAFDNSVITKSEKPHTRRILLYSHELTYTGAPHSLLRIARILKKAGYDLEVWAPEAGAFSSEFEASGIKVSIVPYKDLSTADSIKNISSFDLAIANTVICHRFYDVAHKLIPTIWFIREAHNLPEICDSVPLRRNLLCSSPDLYCVSEYAKEFISSHYNSKVQVIHNCVEDYYTPADSSLKNIKQVNFIAIGTFNKRKAFDVCYEAFSSLPKVQKEKAHFYFAGRLNESSKDFWKPLIKKISSNPYTTYLGEITDTAQKISVFKDMNVFVVVSRDESCSLVALEGAMLGKPLIVSENVGAKYIVDDKSGWIVKTGDIASLREVLSDIIQNPQQLIPMGANARNNYLQTSTISIYETNILKMVRDRLRKSNVANTPGGSNKLQRYKVQIERLKIERDTARQEISAIHNSVTYRVGRFITFIPRKIRGGIRCYQEHGMSYTLRRVKEKFLSLFGR